MYVNCQGALAIKIWPGIFISLYEIAIFLRTENKHMFTEHMLDKHVFEHENKTALCLEDIKTFHTSFVIKQVVFI